MRYKNIYVSSQNSITSNKKEHVSSLETVNEKNIMIFRVPEEHTQKNKKNRSSGTHTRNR